MARRGGSGCGTWREARAKYDQRDLSEFQVFWKLDAIGREPRLLAELCDMMHKSKFEEPHPSVSEWLGGDKQQMTRDEFMSQELTPEEQGRWRRFVKCHNAATAAGAT